MLSDTMPYIEGAILSMGESIRKRSVEIAGHRTSVSIEEPFWAELHDVAIRKNISINQLITGIDRFLKSGFINTDEIINVFVITTSFARIVRKHSRCLCQRLEDKHARHNRMARKVALKEWLIDTDVLNRGNGFGHFISDDAINQQKRIPVGQDFQNFGDR